MKCWVTLASLIQHLRLVFKDCKFWPQIVALYWFQSLTRLGVSIISRRLISRGRVICIATGGGFA